MDVRPGGSVVRQGLYLSYCTVSRVLRVSAGRVVVGSSCDRGAVGAAVPCDRDRRVERLDLYPYIGEYLTTWCNRRELAHPDNEDRPGIVREVL